MTSWLRIVFSPQSMSTVTTSFRIDEITHALLEKKWDWVVLLTKKTLNVSLSLDRRRRTNGTKNFGRFSESRKSNTSLSWDEPCLLYSHRNNWFFSCKWWTLLIFICREILILSDVLKEKRRHFLNRFMLCRSPPPPSGGGGIKDFKWRGWSNGGGGMKTQNNTGIKPRP